MVENTSPSIGSIQASRAESASQRSEDRTERLTVSAATPADAPDVIDVIADSFHADPIWSWAFPDPQLRRRWWSFCIGSALRYPWILRTAGFECVSVWIPPSGTEFSSEDEKRIPDLLRALVGSRFPEVDELLRRFGAAHPRGEPHYYLSLLGTRSEHRGRGLGMALLRENLARIDAQGAAAYLESSNPSNDRRYESVGFMKVVEFQAPGGGPVVTGMWRKGK